MIRTYRISKKQTLLDACLQVYGTSQLLFIFAKDNGLSIDSVVSIGDELTYDDTLGEARVINAIEITSHDVGNEGSIYSDWILASGFWNDAGIWIDTEFWID